MAPRSPGRCCTWSTPAARSCPDQVTGDIEIAGAGLARGYWRDLAADRRAFPHRPRRPASAATAPAISAATARIRAGGSPIEFLGREDFQVKVQGHRIELGEVEAALAACPGVSQAVATTFPAPGGEKTLHGFVVLDGSTGSYQPARGPTDPGRSPGPHQEAPPRRAEGALRAGPPPRAEPLEPIIGVKGPRPLAGPGQSPGGVQGRSPALVQPHRQLVPDTNSDWNVCCTPPGKPPPTPPDRRRLVHRYRRGLQRPGHRRRRRRHPQPHRRHRAAGRRHADHPPRRRLALPALARPHAAADRRGRAGGAPRLQPRPRRAGPLRLRPRGTVLPRRGDQGPARHSHRARSFRRHLSLAANPRGLRPAVRRPQRGDCTRARHQRGTGANHRAGSRRRPRHHARRHRARPAARPGALPVHRYQSALAARHGSELPRPRLAFLRTLRHRRRTRPARGRLRHRARLQRPACRRRCRPHPAHPACLPAPRRPAGRPGTNEVLSLVRPQHGATGRLRPPHRSRPPSRPSAARPRRLAARTRRRRLHRRRHPGGRRHARRPSRLRRPARLRRRDRSRRDPAIAARLRAALAGRLPASWSPPRST